MSSPDRQRSFFATTTGVVTGVAGLVTAVVGLLTVGVQVGWWGSDDGSGGNGGSTASTTASTAAVTFSVEPAVVAFQPLAGKEQVVTVTNSSPVPITLRSPTVSGRDANAFTATSSSCTSRLDPGRKCDVRVSLVATRAGDYTARLVLQPDSGPAKEVDLTGKILL